MLSHEARDGSRPKPGTKMKPFRMYYRLLVAATLLLLSQTRPADGSEAMKRLYEDLFTDYNRLILPIAPNVTKVNVTVGLKLGQILDLNLKQQILSTNVWLEQTWHDYRLRWDPSAYGGIDMIHVPAENIWIPDIVLFNNADGNYELTLIAKAVLYPTGMIVWKPPTMFRSTCEIDVEFFPFDIQTCFLRFGSWSYGGDEVDIKHVGQKRKVDIGIDLSQFYKNVEWDIIDVPAYYNEVSYDGRSEPFQDITFKIVIRRKMLFYLVNLILPVALMTFMTVSVFYLPADSNEKVTLSISILTSLIVFFLLMLEVIPPTSLAVPLFGKYLLFTLVLVSLSACVSVYVLNIYHRAPSVHQMSPQMRQLFLKTLPKLLRLDRPDPRERSSLNRFRKKKLAQQQRKVYDLSQPLAASLNLIETLQKSYDFNPKDDTLQNGKTEVEEEGRYFRRYVDNYLSRLQTKPNSEQPQNFIGNKGRLGFEYQNSSSSSARTAAFTGSTSNRYCNELNKCCPAANRPFKQASIRSNRPTLSGTCCSSVAGSLRNQQHTKIASFDNQRPRPGFASQVINDDTMDMTFDYEDQEGAPPVPPSESDLPSPPPPPRQVAKLGDSMKDLSGRLSSCSQKGPALNATSQATLSVHQDDDDEGHLVDKLISSINLINNVSDDIDSPTTTSLSNNDEDYRHLKAMAQALNSGPPVSQSQSYPVHHMDQTFRQRSSSSKCTCNQPLSVSELGASNSFQQNTGQPHANGPTQCQCNYATPPGLPHGAPQQQQLWNQNSREQKPPYQTDQVDGGNGRQERPSELLLSLRLPYDRMPDHVRAAVRSILFIADTIKNEDDENSAIEDWESMSMVVDRLFLWIFFLLCTFGSLIILALAPSLYDQRDSMDDKLRVEIPKTNCAAINESCIMLDMVTSRAFF